MLHGRYVSELEKLGVGGRKSANTVPDSDVSDPGDTEMVHLKGKDEEVA